MAEGLALVLHARSDPTPVVEKLTSWALSQGKQAIVDASAHPMTYGVRGHHQHDW